MKEIGFKRSETIHGPRMPARLLAALMMGFVNFGRPVIRRRKANRCAPEPHVDPSNPGMRKRTPVAFELDLSDHEEHHHERIEASSLREAVAKIEAMTTDAGHWLVPSERQWIRENLRPVEWAKA